MRDASKWTHRPGGRPFESYYQLPEGLVLVNGNATPDVAAWSHRHVDTQRLILHEKNAYLLGMEHGIVVTRGLSAWHLPQEYGRFSSTLDGVIADARMLGLLGGGKHA
jgi:hypothetical protein